MRSFRVTLGAGIGGLRVESGDRPLPGRAEVVVRVRAVSLSYRELMIVRGWYPLPVKRAADRIRAAWNALTGGRGLQSGETVLTLGTGGVSLFAIQFAKAAGARVIATTSSEERAAALRTLGADDILNYLEQPDWVTRARDQREPDPRHRRSRVRLRRRP